MSALAQFSPTLEDGPAMNLEYFVAMCRNEVKALGKDLPFDADVWDVSDAVRIKSSNSVVSIVFEDWNAIRSRPSRPMREPFKSFAKAYVRYQYAMKPNSQFGSLLVALRSLDAAIHEFDLDDQIWLCSSDVFNRAAALISERYSIAVAYHGGRQLEQLVRFMSEHKLVSVPADWRNPLPRAVDRQRVGDEFDRMRERKLPSTAALNALAKLFHLVSAPRDQLIVSVVAILCSAPDRLNEVLHLPVNCEVDGKLAGSGEPTYGLRWFTSKDGAPMIKWIVQSMHEVVREALEKIRGITQQAREVAAWYEANPGKMFLPSDFEYLRQHEYVTTTEVGQMTFQEYLSPASVLQWLRLRNVQVIRRGRVKAHVKFKDLERVVVGMLPRGFPYVHKESGLRYSNALCTFFRNGLHPGRSQYVGVIDILEHGDIHSRLGSDPTRSLFQRFDFTEDDGSEIRIRSHQFRHYLNTLAQAGGLSQLDIAKWSGRKQVKQNDAYDHMSDRDLIADMRSHISEVSLPSASVATRTVAPYDRNQFTSLKLASAHTTDFGFCIHDFSMLPCQLHADCMNCDEQICLKGDLLREANIRKQLAETKQLLIAAARASADGDIGANRWQAQQARTLARLEELCALLDDPNIQVGSIIRLSPATSDSRLEKAKQEKLERDGRYSNSDDHV